MAAGFQRHISSSFRRPQRHGLGTVETRLVACEGFYSATSASACVRTCIASPKLLHVRTLFPSFFCPAPVNKKEGEESDRGHHEALSRGSPSSPTTTPPHFLSLCTPTLFFTTSYSHNTNASARTNPNPNAVSLYSAFLDVCARRSACMHVKEETPIDLHACSMRKEEIEKERGKRYCW